MRSSVLLATLLVIPFCPVSMSARQSEPGIEAARKQFHAGEMKKAAELYLQVVKAEPKSPEANVELIRTLLELEDLANAATVSAAAGAALPDSAPVVTAMGDVLYRLGKVTEASQAYRRALELDPKFARAWWGTGRIQRLSKKGRQARESFIKAYQLSSQDPDIVVSWAETRDTPSEIASALEHASELAAYRRGDYVERLRQEAASLRYLGSRKRCEPVSPLQKTTLDMTRIDALAPGVTGMALPISPEYRMRLNINGKSGTFKFDVMGSDLTVYETSAKKLGIIRVGGDPSTGRYRGYAERLTVGKMEFRNCLVTVMSFNNPLVGTLIDVDGVVGGQLLAGYLLTLKKNSLVLDPLPPLPPGDTEQWNDSRIEGDRQNFTPLLDAGAGAWLVMASVGERPPVLYALTAAGNVSYVTRSVGQSLRLATNPVPPIPGCRENCIVIEIGDQKTRTQLRILDAPRNTHGLAVETAGVLASDFLYQFTVSIDFRNGLLKLE
jgi:Tfp pilus assembly protein PilF